METATPIRPQPQSPSGSPTAAGYPPIPTREEGLRLLRLGYTPIPAVPDDKHPPFAWMEFQKRLPSPRELMSLFDRHPSATGVGLVTSGIVVVDVDVLPGGDSNPFLDDPAHAADLSVAPAVDTPRGGRHFYFKAPEGFVIKNTAGVVADKVDIRASGGFIMVPPSRSSVGEYGWRNNAPIDVGPQHLPELPGWLVALTQLPVVLRSRTDDQLDQEIREGQRNTTLFSHAITLLRKGLSPEDVLVLIQRRNDELCSPTLDGLELRRIVFSASKYVTQRSVEPDALMGGRGGLIQPPMSRRIEFLSMQELAERPAPNWLIPNWIPDRGLGLLIGPPGAGKSYFLLEVAQAVCRGIPVLTDPEALPTRTGWVLVFLPEASASWAARTKAYCDYHGLDYCDDFVCCIQQNDLANSTVWEQILCAVEEQIASRGAPPTLVIVDTLSASIPGRDENAQADMTLLTSHLQSLVGLGAAVIVAHHTVKHGETYRGSSVLLGNCDWMISIVPSGRLREFRAVKLRDASDIDSRAFEIKPHGDSAVCVSTGVLGPWARVGSALGTHPGLKDALLYHGLEMPDCDQPVRGQVDLRVAGVALKKIQASWNRIDPIRPTQAEDPCRYKSAHGKRTTVVLSVVDALIENGVLRVTKGTFSRASRDLGVEVRQVDADE